MSLASGLVGLVRPLVRMFGRRPGGRLSPECQVRVGFDDEEIVCSFPEGTFRRVAWEEITEVRIRTTSDGPFLPDVFWGLHAGEEAPRIVYPQGAVGDPGLLEAMQRRLPGFDNEALVRAMGCTDDAMFVVWRKSPEHIRARPQQR